MFTRFVFLVFVSCSAVCVQAQDEPSSPPSVPTSNSQTTDGDPKPSETLTTEQVQEAAEKIATQADEEMQKIAKTVDQDPRAKSTAAGILQPIYAVAESLAFPAFHWLAFALMTAGVVSYTLQLGLGKLIVLTRLGFSLKEIVSDAVGLAMSVIGLVLTTQAATENSSFTQSPAAVISASAVGALAGLILYSWGQSQELQAAAGRSQAATANKK